MSKSSADPFLWGLFHGDRHSRPQGPPDRLVDLEGGGRIEIGRYAPDLSRGPDQRRHGNHRRRELHAGPGGLCHRFGLARRLRPEPVHRQHRPRSRIGNNVWIGDSAIVCKGVRIGENSIIGAGSVVVRDIPANAIAAGNPASVLKYLDPGRPVKTRAEWLADPRELAAQFDLIDRHLMGKNTWMGWIRSLILPRKGGLTPPLNPLPPRGGENACDPPAKGGEDRYDSAKFPPPQRGRGRVGEEFVESTESNERREANKSRHCCTALSAGRGARPAARRDLCRRRL